MSGASSFGAMPNAAPPPTQNPRDAQTQAQITATDSALTRMCKNLLPFPYVNTVRDQNEELQYRFDRSLQERQWRSAPFEDPSLQNMTFSYYGVDDNVILQRVVEPERKPAPKSSTPSTGPKKVISFSDYKNKKNGATPAAGATPTNGIERTVVKPAAVKGLVERVKADMAEAQAGVDQAKKEGTAAARELEKQRAAKAAERQKSELKRKREDSVRSEANGANLPTTAEKPHATPSSQAQEAPKAATTVGQPKNATTQLPPARLSPLSEESAVDRPSLLPPKRLSPERPSLIPPERLSPGTGKSAKSAQQPLIPNERLSPTLPSNIAEAIRNRPVMTAQETAKQSAQEAQTDTQAPASDPSATDSASSHANSDTVQPPSSQSTSSQHEDLLNSATAVNNIKKKSPTPRNGFRAGSSDPAAQSEKTKTEKSVAPAPAPRKKPQSEQASQEDEPDDNSTEDESLVLKFKFKKQNSSTLQALLRLPARADRNRTPSTPAAKAEEPASAAETPGNDSAEKRAKAPDRRDAERRTGKGVAQKVGPLKGQTQKKTEEERRDSGKRARVEEEDDTVRPPVKKNKVAETPKIVTGTPAPPALRSPPSMKTQQAGPKDVNIQKKVEDQRTLLTKRPRAAEEDNAEPPTKKVKVSLQKNPSTPAPPVMQSPTSSKVQQITPGNRKDVLTSQAMRRDLSTDSHARTPSSETPIVNGASSQNPSNAASKRTNGQPTSDRPSTASTTRAQAAWEAECQRLINYGRELKHAATADLTNKAVTDKRAAAVKALESFLAFILAFTCSDFAALTASPQERPKSSRWRTMAGFSGFAKRACEGFPDLSALVDVFTMVFQTRITDLTAQLAKQDTSNIYGPLMVDAYTTAMKSAAVAEEKMGFETIQERFPETVKGRSKGKVAVDVAALEPGKMGGAYRLPVTQTTPTLVAIRAGHSMIREWLKKENVGYEMKLKL